MSIAAKKLSKQDFIDRLYSALKEDTKKATYKCFNKELSTLNEDQLNSFFADIAGHTYAILRIERVHLKKFKRKCIEMADHLDAISHFIGGNVELPLSYGSKEEGGLTTIDAGIPAKFNDPIFYMRLCLASFPNSTSLREAVLKKETKTALKSINPAYANQRFPLAYMFSLLADDLRKFGETYPNDWDGFRTSYSRQPNTIININAALVCELADYLIRSTLKITATLFLLS
ncbi:hypothetical protein [Nitrosomonas communis]|uniref:hypothetical protein n=1 Tax=Nitrosomonas communis TaxID=44574 RepID=UPI003D2E660F